MTDRATLYAFSRNTLLRAGAGTGKTETLATLYLHLVSGLSDPDAWPRQGLATDRIVALTFTEKAAVEMRERIADAVRALSYESLPPGLDAADPSTRARAIARWGRAHGMPPASVARMTALAESAARAGRALPDPATWKRVGFSLAHAKIGTFHGFAAGVLRAAATDLGIDPAFRVAEPEESDRLLRAAVTEALSRAARADVEAVADLMAAAGGLDPDGDRGVVVRFLEMIRALDEAGVADEDVGERPALDASPPSTFIAADAIARFAHACDRAPKLAADRWTERLLRLARGVSSLGDLHDPAQARACLALLTATPLPGRNQTRAIAHEAEPARDAIEALGQASLASHSRWLSARARGVLLDARALFRQAKRARSVLDFADLLGRLRDALRDEPRLRRAWKRRFDAVLVDEFQDTNRLQRDLLFLLREQREAESIGAVPEASGLEPRGLLLVGDAKQSIYAFRGANVGVFLDTERALANAGGLTMELIESHRSVDAVLAAVNPVTESLLGAGLTAHGERIYDPARDALVADTRGDGEARVELVLVDGERAEQIREREAEAIARRIRALTESAPHAPPHPPGWRAPRLDEIAILVPTWSQTGCIKRALEREGIPYAQLGGPGFWERREVDDLIVLLRLVADPADRLALASVLRGPLVGLSDAALAHVFHTHATLDEILDPPASVREALAADDRARLDDGRPSLRRLLRAGASLPPDEVLRIALAERDYAAVLASLPLGAQRVANVDKLVGLARQAAERGGEEGSIAGFVRYVDRVRAAAEHETEVDVSDVSVGAVQLLSIHAAKGLEWPVVFVAQTSRKRMNHAERVLLDASHQVVALPAEHPAPDRFVEIRRDAHAAEEDDHRRLLYVALTRARDLAIVSGPVGEGDGDWRTLCPALLRLAPHAVRVIKPGLDGPAIPVRATRASADDPSLAESTDAPDEPGPDSADPSLGAQDAPRENPPRIAPRALSVNADALGEFARCPRRFLHRYELGLPEDDGPALPRRQRMEALVRALVRHGLPCPAGHEGAVVSAALASEPEEDDAVRAAAARCARAALAMPVGRALSHEGALSITGLSAALRVDGAELTLALACEVDLVARAESLGGPEDAITVVRIALDDGVSDASWWGEELTSATLALAERLGPDAIVLGAVWLVSAEGSRVVWLAPREPARARTRLLEVGAALQRSRALAQWDALPRARCERMRCGYVGRCHG